MKKKSGPTAGKNSMANSMQELAKTGCGRKTASRRMAIATHTCNDVVQFGNKVKFFTAEALRGVNNTIFDVQDRRIDKELGQRDSVTGTALEQGCESGQGSRGATTGADGADVAQGSEAQQP